MILYLVKSTVLLALLFGLYKLLLENEKMHHFNRFYLLFALATGLTAPLIQYELAPNATIAGIELDKIDQMVEAPSEYVARSIEPIITAAPSPAETSDNQAASVSNKNFPTGVVLIIIYLSVTMMLFLRFGYGLFEIFASLRKGEKQPTKGAILVLLEESITPQSFLRWIFLNKEDYESGKIGEEILEHERAHIQQLHSLDVIFTEIVKTIFWFNPFMYGYKHAVLLNHEFLADEHVVTKISPKEQYKKKLLEFATSKTRNVLSNNFNYSTPKKRILMLFRTHKKNTLRFKKIITSALFLCFSFIAAIHVNAQTISEMTIEELSETLLQKVESKESLSAAEQKALSQLFARLPEVGITADEEVKVKAEAIDFLNGELEKLRIQMQRKVFAYLDYGKAENNPTLEELQSKYLDIRATNTLLATVYNQVRELQGNTNIAPPPPPLPPSPEMILEKNNQ
ncbi:MAG: hypothetical protein MI700_00010 [Balneolales bacterium]|nr:hypothetical protein [Balneolales bacterium]